MVSGRYVRDRGSCLVRLGPERWRLLAEHPLGRSRPDCRRGGMTMHLLAIDPSTKMGWALLIHDHTKPENEQPDVYDRFHYGTFDLGRNKRPGQYVIAFKDQLRDLRRRFNIVQDNIQIVMEG